MVRHPIFMKFTKSLTHHTSLGTLCIRIGLRARSGRGALYARHLMQEIDTLTLATPGYAHWVSHLARNLRLFVRRPLHVCHAPDANETAALLRSLELPAVVLPQEPCDEHKKPRGKRERMGSGGGRAPSALLFNTPQYKTVTHLKSACVHAFLQVHLTAHKQSARLDKQLAPIAQAEPAGTLARTASAWVLFLDGDITIFRSPWPLPTDLQWPVLGESSAPTSPHILFMDDTPAESEIVDEKRNHTMAVSTSRAQRGGGGAAVSGGPAVSAKALARNVIGRRQLNSGFFYVRNTAVSRRFWSGLVVKQCSDATFTTQQVHLNHMIRDQQQRASPRPLHWVGVLPPACFPNGWRFYRHVHNSSCLFATHHNHIRGDADKYKRAERYGTITRAGESQEQFLARAAETMRRMPVWIPERCRQLSSESYCSKHPLSRAEKFERFTRHAKRRVHFGWLRGPFWYVLLVATGSAAVLTLAVTIPLAVLIIRYYSPTP